MSLYDMQCKTAEPKAKPYKLFDSGGLYLEVMPSGSKCWRQKYRFHGKEKRISHGVYPDVSLLEAREKADAARVELREGRDPVLVRLEQKQIAAFAQAQIFEDIAREWHSQQLGHWSEKYAQAVLHHLEKYVFPDLGPYSMHLVTPFIVLSCLQKIEKTNPEMTRRMKAIISHIFKYSIPTGRATSDPTYGLEAALKKFRRGHYASISVDEFPKFIVRLEEYRDRISRQTYLATRLLLLTLVRTQELIHAKWSEIDFKNSMWVVPAERMKMKLPHMVPLSSQALAHFQELKEANGHREYVFASYSKPRKPMSKNTVLVAIKRMGYNGRMTGHGFRSLGLGLLKEKLNYTHEVADRQLAHVPKNSVDRAYDRAQFLQQRIEMMQTYADYIDKVYLEKMFERMAG
jgi:integrase